MSGILKPGEVMQVHGTYAVHVFSPSGLASLENTHFIDLPASWTPVVNCQDVNNSGVVLELAGSVRLSAGSPADAIASLVAINIGGTR